MTLLRNAVLPLVLLTAGCTDEWSIPSVDHNPDSGTGVASDDAGVTVDVDGQGDDLGWKNDAVTTDAGINPDADEYGAVDGDTNEDADIEIELPDGWELIPGGTFMMGSPEGEWGRYDYAETQHEVTLSNDFIIQATEVTQAQFAGLMGYNNSFFDSCSDCPVERVAWGEAAAYCNALSASENLPLCYECDLSVTPAECTYSSLYLGRYDCPGYRLPTEAEWEYAARGGTTTETYAGDLVDLHNAYEVLDSIAWYHNNSSRRTHRVKDRTPNAYGLYDMLGNVWEWCDDGFVSDFESGAVTDPVTVANSWNTRSLGPGQSVRGGAWNTGPGNVRAAERSVGFDEPLATDVPVGFRPVRTLH